MFEMYQEFRPNRRVAPLVECGWARSGSAARPLRVLPDGCADLFVSSLGDVTIAGPATAFYDLSPDQACMFAGLRLRPGAASTVLGAPVDEFTDLRVPLDSVFGVRAQILAEKVFAATTPGQSVALLQDALTDHLADAEPSIDIAVTQAVAMLRRYPHRPVRGLAAAVGVSERQLRRRFSTAVGYGPKRLGRIVRFQRVLDMIHNHDHVRWAELAIGAGYADQAHMINECVALAGAAPTALPRGTSVSFNTAPDDAS
jgi:AraC-like DNA-binding protein